MGNTAELREHTLWNGQLMLLSRDKEARRSQTSLGDGAFEDRMEKLRRKGLSLGTDPECRGKSVSL